MLSETTKPNILIALGSPSDLRLLEQVKYDENICLCLSVASAHRTPKAVEAHAKAMDWDYVIAGAGLTNALANDYARLVDCPVIAVPIGQADTQRGYASILSSTELPPGMPVASVQINDLEFALESAKHFDKCARNCNGHAKAFMFFESYDKSAFARAHKLADEMGLHLENVTYMDDEGMELAESGLAIAVYDDDRPIKTDFPLIATRTTRKKTDYSDTPANMLHVGVNYSPNLILYVAKIFARTNPEIREFLAQHLAKGREKYKPFQPGVAAYEKQEEDSEYRKLALPIPISSQEHLEKLANWEVKK